MCAVWVAKHTLECRVFVHVHGQTSSGNAYPASSTSNDWYSTVFAHLFTARFHEEGMKGISAAALGANLRSVLGHA